jgi:hypothetical protein
LLRQSKQEIATSDMGCNGQFCVAKTLNRWWGDPAEQLELIREDFEGSAHGHVYRFVRRPALRLRSGLRRKIQTWSHMASASRARRYVQNRPESWLTVVQSLQSFAHAPVAAKARDWPFPSELVK